MRSPGHRTSQAKQSSQGGAVTPSDIRPKLLSTEDGEGRSLRPEQKSPERKSLLPNINSSKGKVTGSLNNSNEGLEPETRPGGQECVTREASLFTLTGVKEKSQIQHNESEVNKELKSIIEGEGGDMEADCTVSPVPTPNPEANLNHRELKVMSRSRQIEAILCGNMAVKSTAESKTITIYLQSCATG